MKRALLFVAIIFCSRLLSAAPLTGYVVHFDFLVNAQEGRDLVRHAKEAGAQVINLVPPAHVWDRPDAIELLDEVVDEINARHLKFVITRVDASLPPDRDGVRLNYLYGNILNRPGVLPDGSPSAKWFRTTVGIPAYDQWMEDETRFYAKRYGGLINLIGFNLGPFSEPFVSQRGGFLQYSTASAHYELTQMTPDLKAMVKMPNPTRADYVQAINDWFMGRYEKCRKIWHDEAERKDIPFILQFSGFDDEKFELGYDDFAKFNRKDWVTRADAIGLSIYTNGGYADFGHASIESLVQRLNGEWKTGKPIFVLEGGCENPTPVLDSNELRFFATVAAPLKPVTIIYEFLKDPFYITNESNSGRLLNADGEWRRPVYRFMKELMETLRKGR